MSKLPKSSKQLEADGETESYSEIVLCEQSSPVRWRRLGDVSNRSGASSGSETQLEVSEEALENTLLDVVTGRLESRDVHRVKVRNRKKFGT